MSQPTGTLRIGELAEQAGTTPRTIRYYEDLGLLGEPSDRERGSHRIYTKGDVERLIELLKLKELLGVSLEELRELVAAEDARAMLRREWHSEDPDPTRRREILDEALDHVERQIELIRRRKDEIARLEKKLVAKRATLQRRVRELSAEGAPAHG